MHSFSKSLVRGGLVAVLAAGWLATAGTASAATPPQQGGKTPAVQAAPHGAYAGTQTCLCCHEDRGGALKTGPHSRAYKAGRPMAPFGCQPCHGDTKANLGCEACHGPGKEHADAGGDKTKILRFAGLSPKDASADLRRAATSARSTRCGRAASTTSGTSGCTTCHSVHAPKGDGAAQGRDETALCATCHRTIVNKQLKFNHMPVREGKLACSSCHNVHGVAERQAAEGRRHHQRVVRHLPRREARPDPLGALRR